MTVPRDWHHRPGIVTLIDTADAYHRSAGETGHNERLIARALATYGGDTSEVLVATKGGHLRPGDGSWTVDGSPAHLREAVEASLKSLGTDAIGLYQFHRPDPRVPYEESIGVLSILGRTRVPRCSPQVTPRKAGFPPRSSSRGLPPPSRSCRR